MAKDTSSFDNIALPEYDNLTVNDLRELQKKTRELLRQIQALYPKLYNYTKEERPAKARRGRVVAGEEVAIEGILDAAEVAPGTMSPLANQDLGVDNVKFETSLLFARLEAAVLIRENSDELAGLSQKFGDTSTELGLGVKPVTSAAYELLKPAAKRNSDISTALAPAIDYNHDRSARKAKDDPEEPTKK
jgi:hypothetical protein